MQKIILKELTLVNFKGIHGLTLNFKPDATVIGGENGIGKTTVFDAFTWLLFGKDSRGRSDFNIKTLDATGAFIPHIEHSVSALLEVNGNDLRLTRKYQEKWTRPKGDGEQRLTAHETKCWINDVPCPTKKEYDERVSSLIPENLFRLITNPFAFTALSPDAQKDLLLDMAGNVTDAEIVATRKDFQTLLDAMGDTPLADYLREVAAKKREIKDELAIIPSNIETAQKLKPEAEDWDDLNKQILEKRKAIKGIDTAISDKTSLFDNDYAKKKGLKDALHEAQDKLDAHVRKYRKDIEAENDKAEKAAKDKYEAEVKALKDEKAGKQESLDSRKAILKAENTKDVGSAELSIKSKQTEIQSIQSNITMLSQSIARYNDTITEAGKDMASASARIGVLDAELAKCTEEYKTIYVSTPQFGEDNFICPTCHRPFEEEDVDKIRKQLTEEWNKDKAEKIKQNMDKGHAFKVERDDKQRVLNTASARKTEAEGKLAEVNDKMTEAKNELQLKQNQLQELIGKKPQAPDLESIYANDKICQDYVTAIKCLDDTIASKAMPSVKLIDANESIKSDAEYKRLTDETDKAQKALDSFVPSDKEDTSALEAQKATINAEIESVTKRLAAREQIERADAEIKRLQSRQDTLNQQLAELEKMELLAFDFQKAKDNELLKRINGLFKVVSFKFLSTHLNGSEDITCVCTIDGVPFQDANNASRFNGGLDIINAICAKNDVCAPIFLDNAESVNAFIDTYSQKILLYVTKDKELTIK